jgi:alpha-tubulin suppressor-like RCC1 family protein
MSYLHALSKLIVHGDTFIGVSSTDFPANPKPRQLSVVAGALYFYSTIDGVTDWFPLTKAKDSYVHIQSGSSTEWTIAHNMNREDFLFFVYDADNKLQMVEPTEITLNSFKIKFTAPKTGRCLVFIDSSSHVQKKLSDLYEFVAATRKSIEDTIWPKISGIDTANLTTSIDSGRNISYLSSSGHNSFHTIIDGKLYTANGQHNEYYPATSGIDPYNYMTVWGVKDNLREVKIPSSSPIKKVVINQRASFALLESGELYGWGWNDKGQLGLGHINPVVRPTLCTSSVTEVFAEPGLNSFDVAYTSSYVKKDNGKIYGCGYNGEGQLGLGNTTAIISNWTEITSLGTTCKIVINQATSWLAKFAITDDGRILTTGYNAHGVMGRGNTTTVTTWTDVTTKWAGTVNTTVKDVVVTSSGAYYTGTTGNGAQTALMLITLNDDSKVLRIAGSNNFGQIGNGTTTNSSVAISPLVIDPSQVVQIASNTHGFMVRYTNGDVYAWGNNTQGRLGNGTTTNISTPALVANNVTKIFDGNQSHVDSVYCRFALLKNDGKLYMSGQNDGGYLGLGHLNTPVTDFNSPILIPFNEKVVDVGGFVTHGSGEIIIAKTDANNLYVWGNNHRYGISSDAGNLISTPQLVNLP